MLIIIMKWTPVIGFFLFLCGCSRPATVPAPGAQSVPVLTLKATPVTTYREYPAAIEGLENVEVRPQVGGLLKEINVDEGAFVSEGQRLFQIDPAPFQAALDNAQASLHAAEGALVNANLEIEKLEPLVTSKVVSDYQLKTAKAAADVAKASVEQANAAIRTARINLGYTSIKAPISGYIGRLPKKKGALVGPADPEALTALSDVRHVRVYFSLAEKDFVRFKEQYGGESLPEKLKRLPPVGLLLSNDSVYELKGTVDMIDGQFDKNTGAITFRANFANPKGLLRSGNTGKILLPLEHPSVVTVPQSATSEIQDRVFVFALDSANKIRKQQVVVAERSGTDFIISEGLKEGDRIVTEGTGILQEGMTVKPERVTKKIAAN